MTGPICAEVYEKINLIFVVSESFVLPSPTTDDEKEGAWVPVVVLAIVLFFFLAHLGFNYHRWAGRVWRIWRERRRQGLSTRWQDLSEVPQPKPDPIQENMLNVLTPDERIEVNLR